MSGMRDNYFIKKKKGIAFIRYKRMWNRIAILMAHEGMSIPSVRLYVYFNTKAIYLAFFHS
jgi:hypothetical protein